MDASAGFAKAIDPGAHFVNFLAMSEKPAYDFETRCAATRGLEVVFPWG
jgi:hypothetical protein